jgi:hypothetical protein
MRELTKSTLSAGLAMSLFGPQAMMDVFRRSDDGGRNRACDDLDAVTQAMVDRTGDILRETFQFGDRLQRGLVDMTFGFLTLAPLRSGGGMSSMGGATRQATDQMSRWLGGMGMAMGMDGGRGSGCGCSGASSMGRGKWSGNMPSQGGQSGVPSGQQGWGPMPGS